MSPNIDILLSTFNGEKYLAEQINSLRAQEAVDWHILSRDDGSTDRTSLLLDNFKKLDPDKFTIIKDSAGNLGPALSFLSLLTYSKAAFTALCDQDDIWAKTKLITGIEKLTETPPNIPALYFSNVEYVDCNSNTIGKSKSPKHIGYDNALVENVIPGCTIIMNKAARELVVSKQPKSVLMHDWWIYLVISGFGIIFHDQHSHIKYRQHPNNFVGYQKNRLYYNTIKIVPFLKSINEKNTQRITNQINEFLLCYGDMLQDNKKLLAKEILSSKHNFLKRLKLIITGKCFRNSFWDSFAMCIQVFIGKY